MSCRHVFLILAFAAALPLGARGQVAEENEGESVKAAVRQQDPDETLADVAAATKRIVARTNDFRLKEDLRKVEVSPKLSETAQYFADFMAREDKYGHQADGQRPAERASEHGYEYCIVSENIAYQFDSAGFAANELAKGFFQGWKRSPGHRKNMLDPDVTQTGVAIARSDKSGYYYAVQMFGRPKSMSTEFQITNNSDAVVEYEIGSRTFPLPPRVTRTHQRCRPRELTIQWPNEQESTTVQPSDNDHYAIVREETGKLRVETEQKSEGDASCESK